MTDDIGVSAGGTTLATLGIGAVLLLLAWNGEGALAVDLLGFGLIVTGLVWCFESRTAWGVVPILVGLVAFSAGFCSWGLGGGTSG